MEFLGNLWGILTTENENLVRYVSLPLTLVEMYVTLKLFTTILGIKYTNKQRNIYLIITSIMGIFTTLFIPSSLNLFVGLLFIPTVVTFIFKIPFYKSIIAQIITLTTMIVLDTFYVNLCSIIFGLETSDCKEIIIYRIPYMITVYLTILMLSKYIKALKLKWNLLSSIDACVKRILIVNLLLVLVYIAMQFYLLIFYSQQLPLHITLFSLVTLIAYSTVSIYSIIKTLVLENTKRNLRQVELHNKSLELLYNNVSAFRHDISNIITALGGFIYSKNMDGLEKYYDKILDELNINNNLSTLNPKVINNPAIYNILATKYYRADELNIDINLQVFINLNDLKFDVYDFCRILGILLDNAIEASSMCEEKLININITDIKIKKCQILSIENTYLNKDIDISRLAEKGYSTKKKDKKSHGIGLWQVSKIINKHNNVILDTTKDEKMFKQELAIYY